MAERMRDEDVELHAWPLRPIGGQHVGMHGHGVLAVHRPTGIAAVAHDERSQMRNKSKAIALRRELVEGRDPRSPIGDRW